jgi:hypothetical protein
VTAYRNLNTATAPLVQQTLISVLTCLHCSMCTSHCTARAISDFYDCCDAIKLCYTTALDLGASSFFAKDSLAELAPYTVSARLSTLAVRSSVEGALARRRQLAAQAARRVTSVNGRTTVESSSMKRKRTDDASTIATSVATTSVSVINEADEIAVVVAPRSAEALQYVATAALVLPAAAALICCEERGYVLRGMQLLMKLTTVRYSS